MPVAIYVINLDRDGERRAYMERTLSHIGLAHERFPAVDAKALSPEQTAFHQDPKRAHLGAGEIAVLLSHIGVWKKISEGKAEFGLIFEDDIHIAADFAAFLKQAVSLLNTQRLQIHRFETVKASVTLQRAERHRAGPRKAYVLETNHSGTAAYLINKPTARYLISQSGLFSDAADISLFDPSRRKAKDVEILQWLPAPCVQDVIQGHQLGFRSNLIGDRADIKAGIKKNTSKASTQFKAILRPAYTALYSAALLPSGRWRTFVPFG